MVVIRDAVLDEHAGDADRIQPGADLGAFKIVGEDLIAAAGKDQDRRGRGAGRGSGVEGQGGFADVAETDERPAGNPAVSCGAGVVLGSGRLGGLGRAVRPEGQRLLLGRGQNRRGKEREEKQGTGEAHAPW